MMDIWIDALENYLGSSEWQQSIEMFVEANKSSFRFSREEHHHNHYRIWRNYQEIVEQILDVALDKIGGNIQSLEKALDEIASYTIKQKKKQEWNEVFIKLMTYQSFEDFSDMMRQAAASVSASAPTTTTAVMPGRSAKSHSVDDDDDDDDDGCGEEYQQRMSNGHHSNGIEASANGPSQERLRSDLQTLGFPIDLVELCLDSCDDGVTLEDLVVMLSEMTTTSVSSSRGTVHTSHRTPSTSSTGTNNRDNNRGSSQHRNTNTLKATSPSSQADYKSSSVDMSIACLRALSAAVSATQTTSPNSHSPYRAAAGKGSNSYNSSSSKKEPLPLVMDAERLQTLFSAAESILATVHSDESSEVEDDTLALIQWAVAMVELWEEALLAYQEGLPFHESRRGHSGGLVVWIAQLEGDRVKAEESSAIGRLLSNSELEKLAALNYLVDSMGSEDEKRLHALIIRNEQSQKELSRLHNRVSLVLQAESGLGESRAQRLQRREEVEELYLFLKEQLSSSTNPETAASSAASLMRGRQQALRSCARGGALVTLLLELHLLEDEMIFLRKCIQEELSQQGEQTRKSEVSDKSPDSGFKLLALAFENDNGNIYSNIPNVAEEKYSTTNLEVDGGKEGINDDPKKTVTLPTLEDLLEEMLVGMDTHPTEQSALSRRRESGVTAEDLHALNIGKELLANALNANYSASIVLPVEEEEAVVRAVANAIMNRHDLSQRNLQSSLSAKKTQSANKLQKQLESRKKKREDKLSQLSDNDEVGVKLDAENDTSAHTQDRITEEAGEESNISLRNTLYALAGVILPPKLKLTAENTRCDNDEKTIATSNGQAALTATGTNLSLIISEFDNIGRALVNAYRYNKDNILTSNVNEVHGKGIEMKEDSKGVKAEEADDGDGEAEGGDSSSTIKELLENNADIEPFLLRVTSEAFVDWLNLSAHSSGNHNNQLNTLEDISNYENMRSFIKKQFLINNVKLEYLLDEAHHRSNLSLRKRKANIEAVLQMIDSSLETVLNLEVGASLGIPVAVHYDKESKSNRTEEDFNVTADVKDDVDEVVTSTYTSTEKGAEPPLGNVTRKDSSIIHRPQVNREIQEDDVIPTIITSVIPENTNDEKVDDNSSVNDHTEDTRSASHSSKTRSDGRRQAPLLPALSPPSYASLFGNNANADAGKLVKEHQEKLRQLEDGLRAQMLERHKILQKRLHKKKQGSETADYSKSEASDDSDDLIEKMIDDKSLDEDRLEHLMKQAIEKVVTMIRSEIDQRKVLELDHVTLVRAVEQLLMSSSNCSASSQDSSTPLLSYPHSRSSVAELLSLARAKEAEELRAHARRISTQYTEEQQRHDLNLRVQQAKQKQLLQRKLLERNSTSESKTTYSNAMKDVMTVKLPSMSAFNAGVNITGLASRGMNLTPMQRRK